PRPVHVDGFSRSEAYSQYRRGRAQHRRRCRQPATERCQRPSARSAAGRQPNPDLQQPGTPGGQWGKRAYRPGGSAMTETRLRTWTHAIGYGLAALFTAALAMQNLRYGFYQLFYLALAMTALLVAGLVYTWLCRRQQLSAPGHLVILAGLNSGLVAAVLTMDAPGISHWAMPLLSLNLLILPLRHGLMLSAMLLVPVLIVTWLSASVDTALLTTTGLLALLAVTGLYIWHYDHMAQSAQDLAITDPATGAHNARFLDETLQKEISRAIATG